MRMMMVLVCNRSAVAHVSLCEPPTICSICLRVLPHRVCSIVIIRGGTSVSARPETNSIGADTNCILSTDRYWLRYSTSGRYCTAGCISSTAMSGMLVNVFSTITPISFAPYTASAARSIDTAPPSDRPNTTICPWSRSCRLKRWSSTERASAKKPFSLGVPVDRPYPRYSTISTLHWSV
uniref:Secreted protein n=1 Tax=Anopheles coluzzii TaxID=1518534 RepID=A0A8W7PAM1_ANOCL